MRRALLTLLLTAGCGAKINPTGNCEPSLVPVTYVANIEPLLRSRCQICHAGGVSNRRGAPGSVKFDTYDDARDSAMASNLDILGGRMPPSSPLDPNDRCLFDAWVSGGMLRD